MIIGKHESDEFDELAQRICPTPSWAAARSTPNSQDIGTIRIKFSIQFKFWHCKISNTVCISDAADSSAAVLIVQICGRKRTTKYARVNYAASNRRCVETEAAARTKPSPTAVLP